MDFIIKRKKKKNLKSSNSGEVFIADTSEKCERVLRMLEAADHVGVDTETFNCDPRKEHPKGKSRVISIQFSVPDLPRIFVPNWGPCEDNLLIFKKWLRSERKQKLYHNGKWDLHALANHGIVARGLLADTMVMDFVYNTARYHGLKECIADYFDEQTTEYGETFREPKLKRDGTPGKTMVVPSLTQVVQTPEGILKLIDYSTKDPLYTVRLYKFLRDKLSEVEWCSRGSMHDYYEEFEVPFTNTLFNIERRGCLLDEAALADLDLCISGDIVEVERTFLHECVKAGVSTEYLETFNMGSPKQLGELFEQKLRAEIPFRTKTGQVATHDKALRSIRGAKNVTRPLLEWRRLNKLLGTYVHPFQGFIGKYDGHLHTNLKQIGTRTMRLSSSTPNLQNIPRAGDTDKYGIRAAFIAPPGMTMADADLSQIEMRLMAHMTKDEVMTKAILAGIDLHSLTASRVFPEVRKFVEGGGALTEVKDLFPKHRQNAKTLNFGVGYGMSEYRYAAVTKTSEKEGKRVIDAFFQEYAGLKTGIRRIQRECHRTGYVRTLLRRYIHIPEIHSQDFGQVKHAERQAFNYVIQGSAADLLKMSMNLIDRDEKLKKLGVRMVLQIHDELVFEVPKGAQKEAKPIIEDYMSRPYKHYGMKNLSVDTPADLSFGPNWAEAKG